MQAQHWKRLGAAALTASASTYLTWQWYQRDTSDVSLPKIPLPELPLLEKQDDTVVHALSASPAVLRMKAEERRRKLRRRRLSEDSVDLPNVDDELDHHAALSVDPDTMVLLSGSAHPSLARRVAELLGIPVGGCDTGHFADGETSVKIQRSVRGLNVYIIQPTGPPINDNLMELLLLVSAARRASASKITAIIPYYGYCRQDRIREKRETIAAADVALMLQSVGADHVISVDLHRGQIQGFFDSSCVVDNIDVVRQVVPYVVEKNLVNPVIVCPSATGLQRTKVFRDQLCREGLQASLAFVAPKLTERDIEDPDESHHRHLRSHQCEIIGDVLHHDVILVDDMIDTGSRVVAAAKACVRAGALRVFCVCTHGLFSGEAARDLAESPIEQIIVADTIPLSEEVLEQSSDKIRVVSIAPLLAEAIRRMQQDQTLSVLESSV